MAGQDDYTDDYVANLLKQDAKATSSAAMNSGLGSLLSKRPTGSAPKPNTRFLKNLIRDTDSHNAALLAREAEESRARLRRLREEDRVKIKPEQRLYSARARHDGTAGPPAKKRRLSEDDVEDRSMKRERHGYDEDEGSKKRERRSKTVANESGRRQERHGEEKSHARSSTHRDLDKRKYRVKKEGLEEEDTRERTKEGRRRRRRSYSRSSTSSDNNTHRSSTRTSKHHSLSRRRSRSPDRHAHRSHTRQRSTSPAKQHRHKQAHHHKSRHARSRSRSNSHDRHRHHTTSKSSRPPHLPNPRHRSLSSDSSDPLEAIIGPLAAPPIRSKGRGAFNRPSAIDTHFDADYNPSADVAPDDSLHDQDDWDQSLEALRDRAKWRTQGADRLRAAGFSETEIEKWERQKVGVNGERVLDEKDVRWRKQGEGREWDRGKVVDEVAGTVEVRPEWGRLKGT